MSAPPDAAAGERSAHPRRAWFALPAGLTVLNLFFGYLAIVKAHEGAFRWAAVLIMLAAVLDMFDGLVARATNTSSDFGRELDSLADVVSFGLAPALLAHAWAFEDLGNAGWAGAFVFVACGTLRLARFNVMSGSTDRRWFVGLPIPMAASVPVTVVFAADVAWPSRRLETPLAWGFLALMVVLGLLMVSRVRYRSSKDVHVGREHRLIAVLAILLAIVAIAAWPGIVLPAAAIAYAVHGPLLRVARMARLRDGSAS